MLDDRLTPTARDLFGVAITFRTEARIQDRIRQLGPTVRQLREIGAFFGTVADDVGTIRRSLDWPTPLNEATAADWGRTAAKLSIVCSVAVTLSTGGTLDDRIERVAAVLQNVELRGPHITTEQIEATCDDVRAILTGAPSAPLMY